MVDPISFGIIGGDKRQVFLANSLLSDGVPVLACGFERLKGAAFFSGVEQRPLAETAERAGVLLLPLPATRDGKTLNAPFAQAPIRLDEAFAKALFGPPGIGREGGGTKGRLPRLAGTPHRRLRRAGVVCAAERGHHRGGRAFFMRCAPWTKAFAEPLPRCGLRACRAGGRRAALPLVCAGDRRRAAGGVPCGRGGARLQDGFDGGPLSRRGIRPRYQHRAGFAFPARGARKIPKTCIFLDLSSAPGGIDLAAAESLHLHAEQAFSLPGKTAPRAAAESIKQSVYSILKGCEES